MIRTRGLRKVYPTATALHGIDLDVREGELFAYLGPNGAGKTTTIRLLTGLAMPTSGSMRIAGHDMASDTVRAKMSCGVSPQAVNLDRELSAAQNLDIHGRMYGMVPADRKERMDRLLRRTGVLERAHEPVERLSGGYQRRVLIARALMHRPMVLFLDEPTVGLDPSIRRDIWSLVREIREEGTTIFLTTHYIEEAEHLADRVALLREGRIVDVGTPEALRDGLGRWAVDENGDGRTTTYFATREEAAASCAAAGGGLTLRRVTLEDAYLQRTGERIQ